MINLHLWRVIARGQLVATYMLTQRASLSEVEASLGWWDEKERPIETAHYIGRVLFSDPARAAVVKEPHAAIDAVTGTDVKPEEPIDDDS